MVLRKQLWSTLPQPNGWPPLVRGLSWELFFLRPWAHDVDSGGQMRRIILLNQLDACRAVFGYPIDVGTFKQAQANLACGVGCTPFAVFRQGRCEAFLPQGLR